MTEVRNFPSIPKRILLPIDFSPSSQLALEFAADLALHYQAELHLLNVIPFFPATSFPDFVPESSFLERMSSDSERRLAKCQGVLASKGIKSRSTVETGNDVAGNIMEVEEREQIDLLIISTHGLSGWHPLIFGSIAVKVVKLIRCPLLLLRSAKPDVETTIHLQTVSEWWL